MQNKVKTNVIIAVILFCSTVLFTVGFSFVYRKSLGDIIQTSVFVTIFSLFLVFIYFFEYFNNLFDNNNKEHINRFAFTYVISLLFAVLFPLIDQAGWPFVAIGVTLATFSEPLLGIYSASGLIMISTMLSHSPSYTTFLVYFIASLFGIVVLKAIGDSQNNTLPIVISVIPLFILEVAAFIFLKNEVLSAEQFILPIVNMCINTILLFWILKFYSENVRDIYLYKYQELNDQEYSQLILLKEKSKQEYFRSIHTAYLTERIALSIGCNVYVAKNLAYYHRIKKVFGMSLGDVKKFVNDNEFPPEAASVLIDFFDKNKGLEKKEACIVFLCDKLISTLMAIFDKDKKKRLDYAELIDSLLDNPSINSELVDSDLSRKDFRIIKEIMKQETLYYDFLR